MNKAERNKFDENSTHGNGEMDEGHVQAFQGFLSIISKKHTLDILHVIIEDGGVSRFNRILKGTGASPKTITTRLVELCDEGILDRTAYAEIPPRVEYSLTEKGEDIVPIMMSIWEWSVKWGTTR